MASKIGDRRSGAASGDAQPGDAQPGDAQPGHAQPGHAQPVVVTDVVVAVNGYPPNERALPVAVALAEQFGAAIEVASMLFDPAHEQERSQVLQRLAGRMRSRSRPVTTLLGQGTDPSAFILDLIGGRGRLVVLAGGTTILGIPGSTTSDVLRFASAPTVLVGPRVQGWDGPVRRLLVPVDGSAPSLRALPTALAWAEATGARCELVQVLDPATPARIAALEDAADLDGRGDHVESAELERLAADTGHRLGRPVSFDVLHATAADRARAICARAAEEPGTLICMASKGSRHSHAMIAGTTLRVVHLATVPVLVTRS